MKVTTVTNFRKKLFANIKSVCVNNEKFLIRTQNGAAVVINEQYLRDLEETCFILSVPGMKAIIDEGVNTPVEECEKLD